MAHSLGHMTMTSHTHTHSPSTAPHLQCLLCHRVRQSCRWPPAPWDRSQYQGWTLASSVDPPLSLSPPHSLLCHLHFSQSPDDSEGVIVVRGRFVQRVESDAVVGGGDGWHFEPLAGVGQQQRPCHRNEGKDRYNVSNKQTMTQHNDII